MAKITKTTRVYLTIEVEEPWRNDSPHKWGMRGRNTMDEVRRLLDAANITGIGQMDYIVESPTVCSLCGCEWEEDEDGPLCCVAAQKEWRAQQVAGKGA